MPIKKTKEEIRKYQKAVIEQMLKLATSAFGLVAALAWNELIKTAIDEYVKSHFSGGSKIVSLGIYALIVTVLAVAVTLQLSKLSERLKKKSEE